MEARIVGTGRFVPPYKHDTDFMTEFAGHPKGWDGDKVRKLSGINNRYFAVPLNAETGLPEKVNQDFDTIEVEMAETAARKALAMSGYATDEVDMLIFVSCTAQRGKRAHFASSAHELHRRLEMRRNASVDEMDAGCGGAVHAIERMAERLGHNGRHVAVVVATNMPSQYMNRQSYLETGSWFSSLIFGDGAAAIVLDDKVNGVGLLGSVTEVYSDSVLMEMRDGEEHIPDLTYHINGREVKEAFGNMLQPVLDELCERVPEANDAKRVILHQVNRLILEQFIERMGYDPETVPIHVDYRGNIAAAATLDILAEQFETGALGSGDIVIIAAVGAGAQVGALAFRL